MLAVAADNARAKWRMAAMDAQPDMQSAYDSADDQAHGSPLTQRNNKPSLVRCRLSCKLGLTH